MYLFFGFSYWKHDFISPFFSKEEQKKIRFINPIFKKNYFQKAMKKGLSEAQRVYIWGKKPFPQVEEYAKEHGIALYRVEDGFIRSVGLGSDLTRPYSLVIDSRGIYFDPSNESDLEHILEHAIIDEATLERAQKLIAYMVEKKLSKYNLYENVPIAIPKGKRVLLVPGQVEDDASIRYGAFGMNNLKLLQKVREKNPSSYIVYKPHPDVLAGNRVGNVPKEEALRYADAVVSEVGIDSVLEVCDEVHTMTSLVGFEALLRSKEVYTYGTPFYAGWGVTNDEKKIPRRTKKRSVEELAAAAFLLYPKYIHPQTLQPCEVEELLEVLERQRAEYKKNGALKHLREMRNKVVRKAQAGLRMLGGR